MPYIHYPTNVIMAASESQTILHEEDNLSSIKLDKSKNGENADKEEEYIVTQLNEVNTTNHIAKSIQEISHSEASRFIFNTNPMSFCKTWWSGKLN